jgi:XTP/dITP diphosphohydrolase
MELMIASRNPYKIDEIKRLLLKFLKRKDILISSLLDYKYKINIEEDKNSYKENAIKKAKLVAKFTNKISIADDSGIEVEALGGAPGIFSSSFGGNEALLDKLKDVTNRRARYVCYVAIATPKGKSTKARGTLSGSIAEHIRGTAGFGYDPIFIPRKYNKTIGELGIKVKDKISHRKKAIKKISRVLNKWLKKAEKQAMKTKT